jgi:hypothetical protein
MTIQEIFDNVFQTWMPFDFQFFLFGTSVNLLRQTFFSFSWLMANVICHIFPSKVSTRRGDITGEDNIMPHTSN